MRKVAGSNPMLLFFFWPSRQKGRSAVRPASGWCLKRGTYHGRRRHSGSSIAFMVTVRIRGRGVLIGIVTSSMMSLASDSFRSCRM